MGDLLVNEAAILLKKEKEKRKTFAPRCALNDPYFSSVGVLPCVSIQD